MPRMNGTGPAGQGPLTGRRQGRCGTLGLNRSRAIQQQSSNWFGRLMQGVLGGFGLGIYGARREGGRGRGGFRGQGQGGREGKCFRCRRNRIKHFSKMLDTT